MIVTNEKQGELERLEADVERTLKLYESYIYGSAIRTRQMIENKGIKKTLEDLVQSSECQQGFKKLYEHGDLDKSFEALVLRYSGLFSDTAVQAADYRFNHPDVFINL